MAAPAVTGPATPGGRAVPHRTLWLAAAALVLVAGTVLAYTQPLRPDPDREPAITDASWWLSPVERNAFARLPVIVADLNDVFVAPGSGTVWVVGESGMIARSRDGGRTWEQRPVAPPSAVPPTPPAGRRTSGLPARLARAEAQSSRLTRVPDVRGRSLVEAREILGKNDLRLEVDSKEPPDPRGVIELQKPGPGTTVPAGTIVLVLVGPPRASPVQQAPDPGQTTRPDPAAVPSVPAGPNAPAVPNAPAPPTQRQPPAQGQPPRQPASPAPTAPAPRPPVVQQAPAPPPERPTLFAVYFASDRQGWAVGEQGTILATTDGGDSWQRQASGTRATLQALHAQPDGRRAWAVGLDGTIVTTADGGRTWRRQPGGVDAALFAVTVAPDGLRGWVVGEGGTILVTTTGGEQWGQISTRRGADLYDVAFDADGRQGWAVGEQGLILVTEDGGRQWRPQPRPASVRLRAVRPVDSRRAWVVGDEGTILLTVDGGTRWERQQSRTQADLRALHAQPDGIVWAAGHAGTVLATPAGGPWVARTAGRGALLTRLHADREGRRGVAVGGDGTVLTMADDPRAWTTRPAPTADTVAGVGMLADGERGWAVGGQGSVLATTDGGRRFTVQARLSGTPNGLHVAEDGRSAWVATNTGIFVTTDGGSEWARRSDAEVTHVAMAADGRRGCAVGPGGAVVTTADGGKTWQRRNSGIADDLVRVHVAPDGRRAWAVGADGTIVLSTDAGATWERRPSGTRAVLLGTHAVDGGRGWAVGWDGTILETLDGGTTWQPQDSGTRVPLTDVRFAADGRRGWVTGWGVLLTTADGGATWTPVTHAASPARWYYASWVLALALVLPALRRPAAEATAQRSVADVLVSDKPLELGDPDPLGFGQVARGLSRFLRNEQTKPPLTIAITGPWGSGKSSLMNLVRGDLRARGFRPVWFNAWHHQKEEHLLAALLQNVLTQAVPGWPSPEGLIFRARLLWYRSGRQGRLVLPLLALLAGSATYFALDHPARRQSAIARSSAVVERLVGIVNPLFPEGVAKSLEEATKALREVLGEGTAASAIPTGVAGLVLLFMVWRGITAFGVSPADLMASVSGRFRRRALEARVGFRHEFAQQFRDVTRALHPRTMLILIDDLDRCQPDNVLEVLEAVNFLVSSGDCFVIIGMELDRVRRCVGLGFKDVAAELTDRETDLRLLDASGLATEADEGKRRRALFAQQYLEKLVNIEVPVPVPTEGQAAQVIAPAAEPDDGLTRWRAVQRRVRAAARAAAPAAAIVLATVSGSAAAFWLWPTPPPVTRVADARGPVATGASTSGPVPSRTVEARQPAGPRAAYARPGVIVGGLAAAPSRSVATWPLAGLVLAAVIAFLRQPPIVIKDSDEFTRALQAWHPLLFSRRSTPRAAKRFLNRVRYYAMRQREVPEERRIDRLAGRLTAWLRRSPPPSGASPAGETIPEHVLVALSAIEHCHPEWLVDARLFKDPQGFLADQHLPSSFDRTRLGIDRDVSRYREPFARLSAGIRT